MAKKKGASGIKRKRSMDGRFASVGPKNRRPKSKPNGRPRRT